MSWLGKIPAAIVVSGQQLANGTVSAIKLAAGAALSNLGFTPVDTTQPSFLIGNNPLRFKRQDATEYWQMFPAYQDGNFYFSRPATHPSSGGTAKDIGWIRGSDGSFVLNGGNLVLNSGQGIDFGATSNSGGSMSSELLDDYEVGSWTPTLNLLSQTGGSFSGNYVKVGKSVWVSFTINGVTCSDTTQDTSGLTIGNLPFALNSASGMSVLVTEKMYGIISPSVPHTFAVGPNNSTSLIVIDNNYNGGFANASYYTSAQRACYKGGGLYLQGQFQYLTS